MSSVTAHFEHCSVCDCAVVPCGAPAAALDSDDSLPADLPRCSFVRAARSPVVLQRAQRGDVYLNLYYTYMSAEVPAFQPDLQLSFERLVSLDLDPRLISRVRKTLYIAREIMTYRESREDRSAIAATLSGCRRTCVGDRCDFAVRTCGSFWNAYMAVYVRTGTVPLRRGSLEVAEQAGHLDSLTGDAPRPMLWACGQGSVQWRRVPH